MAEILLIRHGETEWNRREVFRGRADVPLSARGREQARLLAEALKGSGVQAVYSSPLSRARQTAEPLAEALGIEVRTDERLVDMSFGQWESRPRAEVEKEDPALYRAWLTAPQEFRAPDGESLANVIARAWPAMGEIAARHKGGRAAIVTHRVVCKVLLCAALGAGEAAFWRVRVDTASISLLDASDDLWVVTRLNDTHHLQAIGEGDRSDF
ncbi:MAG: histidine phosphatase family protein [Armatimonadetes bacterium]|nr:histidine phosphatase family protein [Armatimonadota bacterium]